MIKLKEVMPASIPPCIPCSPRFYIGFKSSSFTNARIKTLSHALVSSNAANDIALLQFFNEFCFNLKLTFCSDAHEKAI
jgi:hypothetical protein